LTLLFLASLTAGEARCQSLLSDVANSPASALPLAYTNDDASRSGTTGEDQAGGESNDEPSSIYSPKGENSPNLIQQTTLPNGDPIPNPPSESAALIAKSRARMARANFDKGMQYRQSGDSSRALIEFLKATREDPKLIDAYYEQALIFREKGFHKLAVSRLEQALAIRPKYSRARLLLATLKLEQGKVSDAVEQLGESLNLQKSQTAIKPDEETNGINLMDGVPPMILQSLHAALPLPAVRDTAKKIELAEASDEDPTETREPTRKETKTAASKRKRRPANRRKIRELIARKYKTKNKNSEQRQNWIAKLFSWPDTFKADAAEDNRVVYADDEDTDDLEPKPASNLKKEFRAQADEETIDENALPRSNKNLLAYNGNPADTLDVLNSKNERKRVIDDSDTVDRPFGWGVDSPSSPASTRPQSASPSREDRSTAVAHAHSVQSNQSPPASRAAHSLMESPAAIEPEQSQMKRSQAERVAGIDRANLSNHAGKSPAPSSSGRATLVHTNDEDGTPFYLNAHKADSRLIASRPTSPQKQQQQPTVKLPPLTRRNPAMVEDEWTKRLRYLAENGTSSLKHGEAFMFSEDTGEAVLFLASGQRIRRMITAPQDSQEVIKMRRPDVLIPKELFFNTSLLGKVVKDPPAPPPVSPNPIPPPRGMNQEMDDEMEQLLKSRPSSTSPTSTPPPNFKIEQIMDNPTGFWNWSKRLLNL